MCQYSAVDGIPNQWHLVHLGSRAVGGAGLVMAEATAVSAEGRISPGDLGLWNGQQAGEFSAITRFIRSQGSVPGIQIGHAGRKASCHAPWEGGAALSGAEGAWSTVAPSTVAFGSNPTPVELDEQGIAKVRSDFVRSASLALQAGFEVLEIHAAHGYLLHSFLSPLSNRRTDRYGGDLANRSRLVTEVIADVREVWPESLPLFVRISATDWADDRGGFSLPEAIEVSALAIAAGADLIDCSSGGLVPDVAIPARPGYQVPFAASVRKEAKALTAAVGMITDADQAEAILADQSADAVFLARSMLADPYWPRRARQVLGEAPEWPMQYGRIPTSWD